MDVIWFILKLLLTLFCIVISIFLYINHKLNYWKARNVINLKYYTLDETSKEFKEFYMDNKSKGNKYAGFYTLFGKPQLLLFDINLIKQIFSVDFQYFHSRDAIINEKHPLSGHLFNANGAKWKYLRTKLTPIFTTAKMKLMVPLMLKCAKNMEHNLLEQYKTEKWVNIRQIFRSFSTDVIGIVAFGIDCNGFDENSEFVKCSNLIFDIPLLSLILRQLKLTYPKFRRFIPIPKSNDKLQDFFVNLVRDIVGYREKNNVRRDDFMQLMIDLKNSNVDNEPAFTIKDIAAQAFLFFGAGFETTSSTMSFCLYELAKNQDIQNKLRVEIHKVLKEHNGDMTYEALQEMRYLRQAIDGKVT